MEVMDVDEHLDKGRVRLVRSWRSFLYADISLDFDNKQPEMDQKQLKILINQVLSRMHGDCGVSINVEVLKFKPYRAFIRFPTKDYVRVRSSLLLNGDYKGRPFVYRINKIAYSLSSLAIDSLGHDHEKHTIDS